MIKDVYTCPMHPEVESEAPGKCPKCGMALKKIQKEVAPSTTTVTSSIPPAEDKGLGRITLKSYIPLLVVIGLIALVTKVLVWNDYRAGTFSIEKDIEYFMIGFFIVFAGFKLMDLKGFAEGYSTYDLLAQKWFGWGYAYPFVELGFGLAMLAGYISPALLWAEVIVMSFSGLGVLLKVLKHEPVKCVCLGTFLKVPLTYVTLIEDFGMAALAGLLLMLS